MKERKNTTEIDFTDQIKQSKQETAELEASQDKGECNNEDCGDCECDKEESQAEELQSEESQAEGYDEMYGHDVECPSCGCTVGKMYMKAGVMRPMNMYASKYSDLYEKVKAADPQRDPDKHKVDIKTNNESQRKIEDMPTAENLREVDEPIGNE
jgi:hypothetical protein